MMMINERVSRQVIKKLVEILYKRVDLTLPVFISNMGTIIRLTC